MLMFLITSIVAGAQDKGLLGIAGTLCATSIGVIGWLDKRLRVVEKDTALNTATVASMDKKIDRLLDYEEERRARN